MFGPVSGRFQSTGSAADWLLGRRAGTGISAATLGLYIVVQILGGICGAVLANVMFDRRAFELATKDRITLGHLIGEVVATAGLIALIFALARTGRAAMSAAAVWYIGAAYWFTLDIRQPAVTIGRMFSILRRYRPWVGSGFIAARLWNSDWIGSDRGAYPGIAVMQTTLWSSRAFARHIDVDQRIAVTDSPVDHHQILSRDRSETGTQDLRPAWNANARAPSRASKPSTLPALVTAAGQATVPNFLPRWPDAFAANASTPAASKAHSDGKPTVLFCVPTTPGARWRWDISPTLPAITAWPGPAAQSLRRSQPSQSKPWRGRHRYLSNIPNLDLITSSRRHCRRWVRRRLPRLQVSAPKGSCPTPA
jgi:hypothetical protein